jgi:ribosomal protein L12E/L44/L45/RPP1/RPP2
VVQESSAMALAQPVLLEGEDEAEYGRLLAQVTAAVRPTDVIEEFWIQDVVELMWEAMRLRRLKTNLLSASTVTGIDAVLFPAFGSPKAGDLAKAWYLRKEEALQAVDAFLAQVGLTMDSVIAQTLAKKLDDIERIDRLLANAEARRHVALREIDRHRAAVAARLRAAAEAIEDGEFSEAGEESTLRVTAA